LALAPISEERTRIIGTRFRLGKPSFTIRLPRGPALPSPIAEAAPDPAVARTLDEDLQNPPEEIPRLLARLDDDADVVYGPPAREQHGWWRDGASVLTNACCDCPPIRT
jgi:hypothetical protein